MNIPNVYRVMFPVVKKSLLERIFQKEENHFRPGYNFNKPLTGPLAGPYVTGIRDDLSKNLISTYFGQTELQIKRKKFPMVYTDVFVFDDGREEPVNWAQFFIKRAFSINSMNEKFKIDFENPFISKLDISTPNLHFPIESVAQCNRYIRFSKKGLYPDEICLNNEEFDVVDIGDEYEFAIPEYSNMYTIHKMKCVEIKTTKEGTKYTFVGDDKQFYGDYNKLKEYTSNFHKDENMLPL